MTAAVVEARTEPYELEHLVSIVNREHAQACNAAHDALKHAVQAGEGLLRARKQVAQGGWQQWVEQNCSFSYATACLYVRIYAYRKQIPADAGIGSARVLLRGLPAVGETAREKLPGDARDTARRLRREGETLEAIAEALGSTVTSVWRLLNNDRDTKARTRQRHQRRAKREALKRVERDKAAKKAGGGLAEAYSLIRRTAQVLDGELSNGLDSEARVHVNQALRETHQAEDEVVRALGLS